ncbi:MAG: extracellular solute-binding protein [Chloroflexi bacterium]|nr:extracellular solute-binding protein [Chloroflexota bacterium]
MSHLTTVRKRVTRRRAIIGVLSLLLVVVLVAAACGEDATPTPLPATAVPSAPAPTAVPSAPAPTAVPAAPAPTAVPSAPAPTAVPSAPAPTTGIRPIGEWTVENPANLAEIEAELENFRGESLVFVSWGGAYQAAQREAYIVPFTAKFGINIIEDSPVEYPKIRVMAETGNITWHVIDVGQRATYQFIATGDLELLDFSIIDNSDLMSVMQTKYSAGPGLTWSTVLAYSTESYPDGGPQPTTWADFFDTDKFPGRRGWRDNVHAMTTFTALGLHPEWMGDPEKMAMLGAPSPELVDETFAFWEGWKDNIDVFWHTGSDCPQLLISGELDMCTAWNGRIFNAQTEGAPLGIAWEAGHLLSTDGWLMPKGLKEQQPETYTLANLFIAWTMFPETAARISQFISYGPGIITAIPLLDGPEYDDVREELPSSSANIVFAILEDEQHTGLAIDEWQERWLGVLQ